MAAVQLPVWARQHARRHVHQRCWHWVGLLVNSLFCALGVSHTFGTRKLVTECSRSTTGSLNCFFFEVTFCLAILMLVSLSSFIFWTFELLFPFLIAQSPFFVVFVVFRLCGGILKKAFQLSYFNISFVNLVFNFAPNFCMSSIVWPSANLAFFICTFTSSTEWTTFRKVYLWRKIFSRSSLVITSSIKKTVALCLALHLLPPL